MVAFMTKCLFLKNQPQAVGAHLEINRRRRIFRLNPDDTRLNFRRRTEVIFPHLGGSTDSSNIAYIE